MKKSKNILMLLMLLISVGSCKSQKKDTKEIVQYFAKEIYLNKETTYESILKFFELDETVKRSNHFKIMIDYNLNLAKELNKNSDLEIKIISYDEAGKNSKYVSSNIYNKLQYEKKENVYFLIFPSVEDKIFGPIIVNDSDKVISFYCYFKTGSDPVIPFMLNKKPKIDIYGNPFK